MPRISAPSVAEHHAQRESALLDAAIGLIGEGSDCTMAAVAQRCGMSRSSVYEYFDSADALARRARQRRDQRVIDTVGLTIDGSLDAAHARPLLQEALMDDLGTSAEPVTDALLALARAVGTSGNRELVERMIAGALAAAQEPARHQEER